MEIRNAVHPEHAQHFTTEQLREHFLVQELFRPNAVKLVYTYYDRLIVGGICPTGSLSLDVDEKAIGSFYLLERREMGIINIGGKGAVSVDGKLYDLEPRESLYIGMGSKDIVFSSADKINPAKFYLNCAPAHRDYATAKITLSETEPLHLGSIEKSNERTIYKYIHPDGIQSCQLVMGMTLLEPNNVWNTMSAHTHQRRVEAYLYFNIPGDEVVFHFMGEPEETRHIVVRNEEAVLSPSWSIHSGAGTQNYTFIWGMAGENQTFTDMDDVPMSILK
ncbi:MAG: 5-dehydro-4-deoxy-D-glucuronate isomerase [Desulfobacteraceae bacterium]|nr:5-dehydro-4-deoxy-D-glucuronate isomerase [Desulfobacteraceae bacterium]